MKNIEIVEASDNNYEDVAELVRCLLVELGAAAQVEAIDFDQVVRALLADSKIWAFLAMHDDSAIGVITLHECAAIYVGGIFGEVSELYVKPDYRSSKVGNLLLRSAVEKGRESGWKRLEVGSPPANESPRTIKFYEDEGFKCTGSRLRFLID